MNSPLPYPTLLPGIISYDTTISGPLPYIPGSDISRLDHQFSVAASHLQIDEKVPTQFGFFTDAQKNLFFIIHSKASIATLKEKMTYASECYAWMMNNGGQEFNPDEPETFDIMPEPLGVMLESPPNFMRSKLPEGHNCLVQLVGNLL